MARRRMARVLVALGVVLLLGTSAFAQFRRKAVGPPLAADEEIAWEKYLVKDAPEPTFRFAVAHQHKASACYGYLYITREMMRFEVIQPEKDREHGFSYPRSSVTEARQWKLMASRMPEVEFKFLGGKTYHFFRIRESLVGEQDPKFRWEDVRTWQPLIEAAMHFNDVLRSAEQRLGAEKPAPPPAPELTLQAEPATVEKGHALALVWTSMNATSVVLQPGDRSMPTQGTLSLTPSESTTYTLTAKGLGGTKIATASVTVTQPAAAAPPTIMLVEPSAAAGQTLEVTSPTLKIRGVAMDSTGFPIVSINGTPANMKPQNAQAAEFWFDSVTLQPGENKFEIVALNRAQGQAKLAFVARYTPPAAPPAPNPKALGKQDILDLLKGFVPSQRVAALVKERGVKFTPTANDLDEIRAAGGQDDLINALKQAASAANP